MSSPADAKDTKAMPSQKEKVPSATPKLSVFEMARRQFQMAYEETRWLYQMNAALNDKCACNPDPQFPTTGYAVSLSEVYLIVLVSCAGRRRWARTDRE